MDVVKYIKGSNLQFFLIDAMKKEIERYEQWNVTRKDGIIMHTDCLSDFMEWMGNNEGT